MEKAKITFLDVQENEEIIKIIQKVLEECYQKEGLINKQLYTDIILTNKKHIRELNKKHMDIDKETDVLSFPMFEKKETAKIPKNFQGMLGDIVICTEQVEKQAKEYGHSFERELSYMVVHGFYHLMGYDHKEDIDKREMRAKEKAVIANLRYRKKEN